MVPAAEFFNRSIDSVMLYMHSYKNKTYKRDIYTSFSCKSWGPPPLFFGRQLLCGTAMKRATAEGVHVIFFISFTQDRSFHTRDVAQRSNSSLGRHKRILVPGSGEARLSRKEARGALPAPNRAPQAR